MYMLKICQENGWKMSAVISASEYTYMYVRVRTYKQRCTYRICCIQLCSSTLTFGQVFFLTCIYVHVRTYVRTYVCTYLCMCKQNYVHVRWCTHSQRGSALERSLQRSNEPEGHPHPLLQPGHHSPAVPAVELLPALKRPTHHLTPDPSIQAHTPENSQERINEKE